MTETAGKCVKKVYSGGGMRGYACNKVGKLQEGGKWYCTIHSPAYRAKKDAERSARISAEIDAMRKRSEADAERRSEERRKLAAYDSMVAELTRQRQDNAALMRVIEQMTDAYIAAMADPAVNVRELFKSAIKVGQAAQASAAP